MTAFVQRAANVGAQRNRWAVRQIISEVLDRQLALAMQKVRQDDLKRVWGEVSEVRRTTPPQVLFRDKVNPGQRIWVNLPQGIPLPSEGEMVCVEGYLRPGPDEGRCSIAWRLEGLSIIENKGLSRRVKD